MEAAMSGIEAKVTSKGQITIPSKLRKRLKVEPGDRIVFLEEPDGRIVVRGRSGTLGDMRGMLKTNTRAPTSRTLDQWVSEARSRAMPTRAKRR
jgi:AbrB family looped-hinge helix DNA binding protein